MSKGQITIPKTVRRKLGVKVGDILIFKEKKGEGIILKKAKTIKDFEGFLPKLKSPISDIREIAIETAMLEKVKLKIKESKKDREINEKRKKRKDR